MNKKAAGRFALLITAATAAVACVMRSVTLSRALDAEGLLLPGNKLPAIMAVFVLLALASVALLLLAMDKRPQYAANFSARPLWLAPAAVGAVLVLFGGALRLREASGLELWVDALAAAGGLLLLVQTILQLQGKQPNFALLLLPCVWLMLKLVSDYKNWSSDPVLLDYCFLLLADITCMLSVYHIAGFCFDRGKRRLTAFWCAAAVVFCTISLADGLDTAGVLHLVGMILWLGASLVQLCTDRPQEKAPDETL